MAILSTFDSDGTIQYTGACKLCGGHMHRVSSLAWCLSCFQEFLNSDMDAKTFMSRKIAELS